MWLYALSRSRIWDRLFALLHIKAFSYKPYQTSYPTNRLRALMHAFNFMETFRELRAGTVYLWRRMRGQEVDIMARRQAVLEGVFGRTRIEMQGNPIVAAIAKSKPADEEKAVLAVNVAVEEMVHVGEERQWLGVGDDYAYGLGYHSRRMREKSDGLEEQIEKELAKRGYSRRRKLNICSLMVLLISCRTFRQPCGVRPHTAFRAHASARAAPFSNCLVA